MTHRTVFVANSRPTGQALPNQNSGLITEILNLTEQFTEEDLADLSENDLEALREALEARTNSFPALSAQEVSRGSGQQADVHSFPALSAGRREAELYGGATDE